MILKILSVFANVCCQDIEPDKEMIVRDVLVEINDMIGCGIGCITHTQHGVESEVILVRNYTSTKVVYLAIMVEE